MSVRSICSGRVVRPCACGDAGSSSQSAEKLYRRICTRSDFYCTLYFQVTFFGEGDFESCSPEGEEEHFLAGGHDDWEREALGEEEEEAMGEVRQVCKV